MNSVTAPGCGCGCTVGCPEDDGSVSPKIIGQIVEFKRAGSLLVPTVTVGIKSQEINVQLLGAQAQQFAGPVSDCIGLPSNSPNERGSRPASVLAASFSRAPRGASLCIPTRLAAGIAAVRINHLNFLHDDRVIADPGRAPFVIRSDHVFGCIVRADHARHFHAMPKLAL